VAHSIDSWEAIKSFDARPVNAIAIHVDMWQIEMQMLLVIFCSDFLPKESSLALISSTRPLQRTNWALPHHHHIMK